MTAVEARTGGRRLAPEVEAAITADLATGMTHRQVAAKHHVGRATVSRVAARQDAAPAPSPAQPAGEQDQPDTPVTPESDEGPETLPALRDKRERLAAQHGSLLDQAQAAREAVEDCDSRRLGALASGGDSTRFAADRARLEADHARLTQDANVVGGWLAETEAEIGRREAARAERDRLAAERDRLAAAISEANELAPVCKDLLKSTVRGGTAAGELVRVATRLAGLEQAAGRSWNVLPPRLPAGARDPWHLEVGRLWAAATAGDQGACLAVLGRLGGAWHDRDPAQLAASVPVVAGTTVNGLQPDQTGLAAANQQPEHWPSAVSLDADGHPLVRDEQGAWRRQDQSPFPPHRHPSGLPFWG